MPTTDVNKAIDILVENGVISSPEYWKEIAVPVMQYLDGLLTNAADRTTNSVTRSYKDFGEALNACYKNNVLNSPGYWAKAATTNKYINTLIINIANHLK